MVMVCKSVNRCSLYYLILELDMCRRCLDKLSDHGVLDKLYSLILSYKDISVQVDIYSRVYMISGYMIGIVALLYLLYFLIRLEKMENKCKPYLINCYFVVETK